jgi:hypothetical protein
MTNIKKVEIAPNVFVNSWNDVKLGYLHVCGDFIIHTVCGEFIHVKDSAEISATIDLWRGISEAPLESIAKIPTDIAFWMNKKRAAIR